MATIGTLSNYLENKLINHFFRNISFTAPTSVWLALYTVSPTETTNGTEVNGGNYYRVQNSAWTISGNTAKNTNLISFPPASAEWGTISGIAIKDAQEGGNTLLYGNIDNLITIDSGETYAINPESLNITLKGGEKGGWGNNIPEAILECILTGTSLSTPGLNVYLALGLNLVVDANNTFVSWTEISSYGIETEYSRKNVSTSSSWSPPTSGSTCNIATINFHTLPIPVDWGRITHIVVYDAATSGQAFFWGKLRPPIWIGAGDGLGFVPAGITIEID